MLISQAYVREQRRMHRNERYGAASKKFAPMVAALIDTKKPASVIDYGAGKGALGASLGEVLEGLEFTQYDPGVKAISKEPKKPADLVCCIDVLEHIEPGCLSEVLDHIRRLTLKVAFLTIHTGPAGKFLSDGRNAHLIQCPIWWWVEKLESRFCSVKAEMVNDTTAILICEV